MATKEPTINSKRDESTELSKTRTREAADRTLMAWIRRSLSFIAFGFGIAAVGQTLERVVLARILGVGFVAVALLAVGVAMVQYHQELKMIEASDYRYKPSLPLGIASGVALLLIGSFAVVGIVIGALVG